MSKHKIIAVLMAPFLAIAGFIAAGYFADSEAPMRALILETECRLSANDCELKTLGLTVKLSSRDVIEVGRSINVQLNSSEKLNDVLISLENKKQQGQPYRLNEKENNQWRGSVEIAEDTKLNRLRLRLVIDWQKNIYFADEKITL